MSATKTQHAVGDSERKKIDRAAAKVAREAARDAAKATAKAEKERMKADAAVRRELVKLERLAEKRRSDRRWLPDSYLDWDESLFVDAHLVLDDFIRVQDKDVFERVLLALQASTISRVFDSIADIFDCDKHEICLLEGRNILRKGKKVFVVSFRYMYNQDFNDVLKAVWATFDQNIKAWNLSIEADEKLLVSESIGKYYRVVIDLNAMAIFTNKAAIQNTARDRLAFYKLPFHVSVMKSRVIESILSSRPSDDIRGDLYINDGMGFIRYPEQEEIWTQFPFLLFRYTVADGRPRYACFSTLGMAVERFSFGNNDKKTSVAIARFMGACRVIKSPVFETNRDNIVLENPSLKEQLHGDFARFSKSIDVVRSVIPDFGFAPLCSDYVTMTSQQHGADSGSAGIIAYVMPDADETHYLLKIAAFFGCKESDYPIVFTRSMLESWDEQKDCDFLLTTAHELAHWLVIENDSEFHNDDDHGVMWAICQDLLEYLFIGEYSITAYGQYHPKENEMIGHIEQAVAGVGIPLVKNIMASRTVTKNDIWKIARDCYMEFVEFIYMDDIN